MDNRVVLVRHRDVEGNPAMKWSAPYLKHPDVQAFPNVHLVSREGTQFKLNAAILAAASKLLASILEPIEFSTESHQTVLTEICDSHLTAFCQFVMSGRLSVATLNPELESSFSYLGINLNSIKLQSVPKLRVIKIEPEISVSNNEEGLSAESQEKTASSPQTKSLTKASGNKIVTNLPKNLPVKKLRIAFKCPKCPFLSFSQEQLNTHKESHVICQPEVKVELDSPRMRKAKLKQEYKEEDEDFEEVKLKTKRKIKSLSKKRKAKPVIRQEFSEEEEDVQEAQLELERKFRCFKCLFSTNNYSELLKHCSKHDLECDNCGAQFEDPKELTAHEKTHRGVLSQKKERGRYFIEGAPTPKKSKKKEDLLEGFIFPRCLHCGADFANKPDEKQKEHMEKYHKDWSNQCLICQDFSYESYDEHKKHNDEFHEGRFVSRCNECSEFFEDKKLLETHKRKVHPKENLQRVICTICGKELVQTNMKNHMAAFHGNPSEEHKCPECGKCFGWSGQLKAHLKTHDKKPCEKCGMLIGKSNLGAHNKAHHTKPEDKRYVCLLCNPVKGFPTRTSYESHMNIHNGVKPHKCDYCQTAFADPNNLKSHIRSVHHGIKRNSNKH